MARRKTDTAQSVQAETVTEVVALPADSAFDFVVVWQVKRDGRRYQPGDTISLPLDQAARLIEVGAITAKG